jgi:hypothetical protein
MERNTCFLWEIKIYSYKYYCWFSPPEKSTTTHNAINFADRPNTVLQRSTKEFCQTPVHFKIFVGCLLQIAAKCGCVTIVQPWPNGCWQLLVHCPAPEPTQDSKRNCSVASDLKMHMLRYSLLRCMAYWIYSQLSVIYGNQSDKMLRKLRRTNNPRHILFCSQHVTNYITIFTILGPE